MNIFITGATGYLGSAALSALVKGGHRVTALARDPEKAQLLLERGAMPIIGELGAARTYLDLVRSSDVVVHAAEDALPVRAQKDRQFLDAVLPALRERPGGGPRAFIYTSGVWALGKTPRPAAEAAPLSPIPHVAWRPAHEQAVLAAAGGGLRTVVLRPGIVYGGGRGIIADLIKDALNGLIRVVGTGKNHWPCVYDRDLGDLYLRLVQLPEASGIYHANDEADERVMDIVEAVCEHVSPRPDVRHMPLAEARKKFGTYADALALDQKVRSGRARELGWTPSLHNVSGSVARLLDEFRSSGAARPRTRG